MGGELGINLWSKVTLDLCFRLTGPNLSRVPFSQESIEVVEAARFKVNELFGEPMEVVGESTDPGKDPAAVLMGGEVMIAKLAKVWHLLSMASRNSLCK